MVKITNPKPGIIHKHTCFLDEIDIVVEPSNREIDPAIERRIPEKWAEIYAKAKEVGKLVYDSRYNYRYNASRLTENALTIYMAPISFSVSYSLRQIPEIYQKPSAYWPRGLSISGFLKTADDFFVFGRRSGTTMSKGRVGLIGGLVDKKWDDKPKYLSRILVDELREEINVNANETDAFQCRGLVMTEDSKVCIITWINLQLDMRSVHKQFERSNDAEMQTLEFISESDLRSYLLKQDSFLPMMVEFLKN